MHHRFSLVVVAALVMIAATAIVAVTFGSTVIPPQQVFAALTHAAFDSEAPPGPIYRIVIDLRLPRVVLAIAVGSGLGVIGLMLQTVTRNDLADPFLFGLSAGAAAGAVQSSPVPEIALAPGRCRPQHSLAACWRQASCCYSLGAPKGAARTA